MHGRYLVYSGCNHLGVNVFSFQSPMAGRLCLSTDESCSNTRAGARICVLQDVRMIFEMFDSNNDGTMDVAEFESITENLRRQGKQSAATRTGFKENSE